MSFKIGNSVKVKPGVKDPDLGADISGWQGRISAIHDDGLVCIDWDSITLKEMPGSVIKKCVQEGLGWDQIYLEASEVELTKARDTEKDVENIIYKIEGENAWLDLGEEGERIQSVLAGIDPEDDWNSFKAWEKYLKRKLKFPFKATVEEFQERGPIKAGDEVMVRGISDLDDSYGIIVDIDYKKGRFHFPLADLEVKEKKGGNYTPVKDYAIWFANR